MRTPESALVCPFKTSTVFKVTCAFVGGFAGFLFRCTDFAVTIMLAVALLECMTRLISGAVRGAASIDAIFDNLVAVIIAAAAQLVDQYIIGSATVCRTAVCSMFIAAGCVGILRNASAIGFPISRKMQLTLSQLIGMREAENVSSKRQNDNRTSY